MPKLEEILDQDAHERLARILTLAAGDPKAIDRAVQVCLSGTPDRARRVYLRNQLTRLARAELRKQAREEAKRQINVANQGKPIPRGVRMSAYNHERQLLKGIPEDDR